MGKRRKKTPTKCKPSGAVQKFLSRCGWLPMEAKKLGLFVFVDESMLNKRYVTVDFFGSDGKEVLRYLPASNKVVIGKRKIPVRSVNEVLKMADRLNCCAEDYAASLQ